MKKFAELSQEKCQLEQEISQFKLNSEDFDYEKRKKTKDFLKFNLDRISQEINQLKQR